MTGRLESKQRAAAIAKVLLWMWILTIFVIYMQNYASPIRLIFRALFG